jgi:putative transposase
MVKNRKLSKVISDAGWGMFLSMLKYKCGTLVEIDRFYPSSQTCSVCGSVNPKVKNLSVRSWVCPGCGTFLDRDLNAARNILREGLSL